MMSYMVAQTVMVLMAGSLADRFGRRRLYIFGMLIFTVVSLAAGFVDEAPWLIVLRVVQGVGGAMLMANSAAIVADAYPKQELGRALGINVMVVAVGQIIGLVLGGWLTTDYGWPWTFWFNVPFGVVAIILAVMVLGLSNARGPRERKAFDTAGVITYLIGVTGLLVGLTWGAVKSWQDPEALSGLLRLSFSCPGSCGTNGGPPLPFCTSPCSKTAPSGLETCQPLCCPWRVWPCSSC